MIRNRSIRLAVAAACALGLAPLASAVIVLGPRQLITSADYLAGGRAQYQGRFGIYFGTVISARCFATVNHIGNPSAGFFAYNNGTATETIYRATFAGRQDDLAVWRLNDDQPSFTFWAPIYTRSNEVGKALTAIGRGTDRGSELRNEANELRGWFWGTDDHLASFGTNIATGVLQIAPPNAPNGFGGDLLYFDFDNPLPQGGDPTECMGSLNDSSGGIFIVDPADNVQKFAGVISLVDGGFKIHANDPTTLNGAIFDARGLYFQGQPITGPDPVPFSTYATRVSSRLDFLRQVAGVPPLPCPADQNGDRVINTTDLTTLLARFGQTVVPGSAGDVNEDGHVDTQDLTLLLAAFGSNCP